MSSGQKLLQKQAPRVQNRVMSGTIWSLKKGGEIPFVMGVMADLSGSQRATCVLIRKKNCEIRCG